MHESKRVRDEVPETPPRTLRYTQELKSDALDSTPTSTPCTRRRWDGTSSAYNCGIQLVTVSTVDHTIGFKTKRNETS